MLLLKADGRLFCTAGRNPVQALAAYGTWTQPVPYANEMVSRALPSMEPCQCWQTQPSMPCLCYSPAVWSLFRWF